MRVQMLLTLVYFSPSGKLCTLERGKRYNLNPFLAQIIVNERAGFEYGFMSELPLTMDLPKLMQEANHA